MDDSRHGHGRSRRARKQDTSNVKWMSNIHPLDLVDNPASGRGQYTTLSVLEPVMRIERSGSEDSNTDYYRIIVTFVLEVEIIGFNQRSEPITHPLGPRSRLC